MHGRQRVRRAEFEGQRAPVVVQAPQADAEDLEDKEGRHQLLLEHVRKARQRDDKAVGAPLGQRGRHPVLVAKAGALLVLLKGLLRRAEAA